MNVGLLYCHALDPGGYPRDVRWLASALARRKLHVRLFAEKGEETEGLSGDVDVRPASEAPSLCRERSVCHVFAPLVPRHILLMARIEARGTPVLLSTFAQLMPSAMRKSRLKKEMYLAAARPWIRRVALHAFGPAEEAALRARYPGQTVFQATAGLYPFLAGRRGPRARTGRQTLRLIFFGRNDRFQKGLDLLLPAFREAVRGGADLSLTICGRAWGDSVSYISSFLATQGLQDRVTCRGEVDEDGKRELISDADFLVFLSRWDGPPRPVREAIACGLPVVVSPETNMGHLVERFGAGVQVTPDVRSVAECFRRLADAHLPYERFVEGAEKLADWLSWDRVAEEYIDMYERVLGGE